MKSPVEIHSRLVADAAAEEPVEAVEAVEAVVAEAVASGLEPEEADDTDETVVRLGACDCIYLVCVCRLMMP